MSDGLLRNLIGLSLWKMTNKMTAENGVLLWWLFPLHSNQLTRSARGLLWRRFFPHSLSYITVEGRMLQGYMRPLIYCVGLRAVGMIAVRRLSSEPDLQDFGRGFASKNGNLLLKFEPRLTARCKSIPLPV
jgi:hypothetical protein